MMKKIIIFSIILLIGFTVSLNPQNLSFRSRALGSVINDDLDLIYDPIELKFVKGSRLYTNLSNLTSGNEQLFDNISDDAFLVGYSTQCPFLKNLWSAFLIQFQNTETSNPVSLDSDLDGFNDIWGNGTLMDEFTSYEDTDQDGIYDLTRRISQEESDFTETCMKEFIFNNTYDFGNIIGGLRIAINEMDWNIYDDYSLNFENYRIEEDYNDQVQTDLIDNDMETENSITEITASVLFPDIKGYEVRGDLQFTSEELLFDTTDKENTGLEFFDPEITDFEDSLFEQDVVTGFDNESGNTFGFGGSIRKTFKQAQERKNDGFCRFGAGINFGSYDYDFYNKNYHRSIETEFDGDDTLGVDFTRIITENNYQTDKGTDKRFGYSSGGIVNIPLDERIFIGIGGRLDYDSSKRETDFYDAQEDIEDYEETDGVDDANDFTITETFSLTADRTFETFNTVLTFPVGIEYNFTHNKKWDMRFGAIFRNVYTTVNDAMQITDSEPLTTITEFGDGTENVVINDNFYDSTSEHTKTTTSNTDYFYGLGFKPTSKLQIDLLGFLETDYATLQDFVQGLKVSFTLLLP